MVLWSLDDNYVVSSLGNANHNISVIKVWDSQSGNLVHSLQAHSKIVYSLETHPRDSRIILSAGYDGMIVLWDVTMGKPVRIIQNENPMEITDAKFSFNGMFFAATDFEGVLHVYGTGTSERYKDTPREQFFATDYNPLRVDMEGNVIDDTTSVPLCVCLSHLTRYHPI